MTLRRSCAPCKKRCEKVFGRELNGFEIIWDRTDRLGIDLGRNGFEWNVIGWELNDSSFSNS